MSDTLSPFRSRVVAELTEGILPYWMAHTLDDEHGGFVGRITHEGRVVAGAPRAAVLNTRILWTFAAAGRVLHDDRYRAVAERAYAYLVDHFWDAEHGGIYWMLDHTGRPLETKKQIYAQAFAVYALAEYYRLTDDASVLERAVDLFRTIERHSFDPTHGGYFEAYSRAWTLLDDVRLSEKDPNEKRAMNTHLHLLEAYTNLYRIWPDPALRQQLVGLINLFLTTILDAETGHLQLVFDEAWRPRSKVVSFGHDIEASWLLVEAAEVVGEAVASVQKTALQMAQVTLDEGRDHDGALLNDAEPDGRLDDDRHWWPQAEAVVGFLNAYQLTSAPRFLDAALACWTFIENHLVDREGGEWFFRVSRDGTPCASEDKVGPWKGPYHNARACLEVMTRVDRLLQGHTNRAG